MNMRMYLPYKATREYQDRGMAKWQGFFLSEHTSEIAKEKRMEHYTSRLTKEEKWTLLTQLYVHRQLACFRMKKKEGHEMVVGVPVELSDEAVYVESQTEARWLPLSDLQELYLVETAEEEASFKE